MIEFIRDVGIDAAAATLGAVILPQMAGCLVGGYGMIAATGALSACLGYPLVVISLPISVLMLTCLSSIHPFLAASVGSLFFLGVGILSMYTACIIMGQAFLPFFACMAVGATVIAIGMQLIKTMFTSENNITASPSMFANA